MNQELRVDPQIDFRVPPIKTGHQKSNPSIKFETTVLAMPVRISDEANLVEHEFFVSLISGTAIYRGAEPETLKPVSVEEFTRYTQDQVDDEDVNMSSFRVPINFNYRIYLLDWKYLDDKVKPKLLYETATYEEAVLIYQQQHQILHNEGPWDHQLQKYPQINIEGVEPLLDENFYDRDNSLKNAFIGILSRNHPQQMYFNFEQQ